MLIHCLRTGSYFQKGRSNVVAAVAAGSVSELTRQVCEGEATNGFAVTRPPGHHAERTHAMGFCLVNNVAVAAQLAREKWGCKRVLIYDWYDTVADSRPESSPLSVHGCSADSVARCGGRGTGTCTTETACRTRSCPTRPCCTSPPTAEDSSSRSSTQAQGR